MGVVSKKRGHEAYPFFFFTGAAFGTARPLGGFFLLCLRLHTDGPVHDILAKDFDRPQGTGDGLADLGKIFFSAPGRSRTHRVRQAHEPPQMPEILVGFRGRFCSLAIFTETARNPAEEAQHNSRRRARDRQQLGLVAHADWRISIGYESGDQSLTSSEIYLPSA